MNKTPRRLKNFFAELDTPGGHIIVCFAIMLVGATMHWIGVMDIGRDLIVGAAAAIYGAMKGRNGSSFFPPASNKKPGSR